MEKQFYTHDNAFVRVTYVEHSSSPFTEISIGASRKCCACFHCLKTRCQFLLAVCDLDSHTERCEIKFRSFVCYVTACNLIVYISIFRRLANSLCGPPFQYILKCGFPSKLDSQHEETCRVYLFLRMRTS